MKFKFKLKKKMSIKCTSCGKPHRKPDETGKYIGNPNIEVNVWVDYSGRCHGSDDYYQVLI